MEVLAGMPGHMAQYRKADQQPPLMFQQPMIFTEGVSLISYFNSNQTGEPEQVQKGNKIAPAPRSRPMSGALLQKSAFHKLEDQQGVIIKQKMDMMELLSGCETQNTYFIYPLGKETMTKEHLLFKCQERSGFCARNCLPGSARSFQMTISTYKRGGEGQGSDYQPFLSLERPCQCTCFCCDRPEISVTLIEDGKNEYLGKIVDPFAFCNLKADVYDEDNDRIYNIEAQCCQPGVMCSLPCEACQKVDFDVKSQYGDVVSTVQKVSGGSCIKASCSDVDNFAVNFPVGASTRKKVLLMCAALLIDYSNFEKKSGNNENHI